jgi:hypothetical protein
MLRFAGGLRLVCLRERALLLLDCDLGLDVEICDSGEDHREARLSVIFDAPL